MKKPIIGITLAYDKGVKIHEGIEYGYIRKEYGREVKAAGGEPLFIDEAIDPRVAARLCDGIIIGGGEDIEPIFYGQTRTYGKKMEPTERTAWELKLITECDNWGKHILGICYGLQLLNVHYGGTLYQDINEELGSKYNHGSSFAAVMHDITFTQDFLSFTANQRVPVASRHHQAVRDIAPGFSAVAKTDDGVVEAISNGQHFGVQWHSESDGTAQQIYGEFINVCAAKNKVKLDNANKVLVTT